MKYLLSLFILLGFSTIVFAQKVIDLPHEKADHIQWAAQEKSYFSEAWDTSVLTNVSTPSLEVFRADKEINTGTSVIIAPGGGLYALSISSEGREVAQWLAAKGITAFVLKYRLVPTGDLGAKEFSDDLQNNRTEVMAKVAEVMPYSVADGLAAMLHVRENADLYGIDPEKIGFMGFSAGGAVTMGVAYAATEKDTPNFLVPVYAWTSAMPVQVPKDNASPMLIVCASDDDLAPGSIELYNSWRQKNLIVGLHMYSKGGHGFGMRKNGIPADYWIERFYEWVLAEGITSE